MIEIIETIAQYNKPFFTIQDIKRQLPHKSRTLLSRLFILNRKLHDFSHTFIEPDWRISVRGTNMHAQRHRWICGFCLKTNQSKFHVSSLLLLSSLKTLSTMTLTLNTIKRS